MEANEINFENLPKAVAYLINEIAEIKTLISKIQKPKAHKKNHPIDIDEACRIIGKAKPTIYALVQKRMIPCYKNGKKLYFFEEELLEWITEGKKKTIQEIQADIMLGSNKYTKNKFR